MSNLKSISNAFMFFSLFFYPCIFVNYLFKTLHKFCSCSALANFKNCIFNKYLYLLELLFWIWLWKWIWKRTGRQGKKKTYFNSFLKRTIIFISKKTTSFSEKTIYLCFILILKKKNCFIIFIFKKTYFIIYKKTILFLDYL